MKKSYKRIVRASLLTLFFGFSYGAQGQYCTPSYTTGCSFGDDLNSVVLNGNSVSLSNLNSGCNGNYSDNTTMNAPDLSPGMQYTISVGTSYTSPSYESVKVWIDYNNNQTFDANEVIAEFNGLSSGLNSLIFNVPPTVTTGIKRMRVKLDYVASALGIAACGSASYGETEDYNVEIVTAPSCMPPNTLTVTNTTGTALDFGWTESNSATEWEVQYGAHGFALGTAAGTTQSNVLTNPTNLTIVSGAEYDFYVRSVCSVGDTSAWAGPYEFKYCEVNTNSGYEYLDLISSNGALVDIDYTATSQPAGSYANETAQPFESFAAQTFDINTSYVGGGNGVNIWVDWNLDMVFDASELVATGNVSGASQTLTVTVPSGTPVGSYRMRIRGEYAYQTGTPPACGNAYYGSTVDFDLTIVTPPTCLPPSALIANNVGETTVDLGWTENGSATLWNIEYGPAGFTPGTGTEITGVTTNPYIITGLTGNTNYDFYVQSDCGGGDISYLSSGYGPVLTECGAYLANGFCEGFDINLSSTIGCWRVRDENNDGNAWQVSTQQPNTGAYSAIFNTGFSNSNDDYLISPQLTLTGVEAMKFAYSVFSTYDPNDFQLLLSTTGTNVADFTDTLMHLAQYTNTDYMDTVVDLTAYTGPVYIAFHVPAGGASGWMLFIDDVCFGECIPTPGQDGSVDVCVLDGLADLTDGIISNINSYGYWEFPANQALIVDDTMFNVGLVSEGAHEIMYIVQGLCEKDTTIATINVHSVSSAGIDGSVTVCKNTPTNLLASLSGSVDMGGTWYDPSNVALPNAQPNAPGIPGMYQYTYVTTNGYCPADTSIVTVTVDGSCNYLSLGDEILMDVSVHPNPATSIITIVNPSNTSSLKVQMLDMNGRVVLVEDKALNNATEATLTIDHIERGIYTLRVYNNEGQKTFKIVKQ